MCYLQMSVNSHVVICNGFVLSVSEQSGLPMPKQTERIERNSVKQKHPQFWNSNKKYFLHTRHGCPRFLPVLTIRIFNACEVRIENSVTRVTVRRHEACRVMPNSYTYDGIFNSHRRTTMDYFSCIRFLRKVYLNFHMRCYINTTLKYLHFKSRHDRFGFFLRRWRRNVWRKMASNFVYLHI